MKTIRLFTTAVCLLLATAAYAVEPVAAAAEPAQAPAPASRTAQLAIQWAQQHGVPTRTVEVGPPERRVTRIMVPVMPEQWADFANAFGNRKGSLLLKLDNGSHLYPIVDGNAHLWARAYPNYTQNLHGGVPEAKAIVVDLTDAEYDHVHQWFAQRAAPNDAYFSQGCGSACMDYVGNIEVAPGADGTNTLRIVSAQEVTGHAQQQVQTAAGVAKVMTGSMQVPTGKKLFDLLGIARSKDGRNLIYNLVHGANDRVAVVGVPMPNGAATQQQRTVVNGRVVVQNVQVGAGGIERFKQMTDAELLGPLPPQGIAGVVRPDKK